MTVIIPAGLQENGDFVDLGGEIITKEEMEHTIDVVNNLPISEHTKSIIDEVKKSVVTIIQAETGSGKTTQVAKILLKYLENVKKIICTEPRVIAAIGAAIRVAKELLCITLDPKYSIGHDVGYRTGKEKFSLPDSKITFVTDGLQLLRQFVSRLSPDILIVDEVHTYSVATEFLLALTKKEMNETRKKIKLILMSATIDTELIKSFFGEVDNVAKAGIPILDIPGRTFPVEKEFKQGDDFIPSILEQAKLDKNVLVFVDGKKEIDKTIEELTSKLPVGKYNIVPLHSELTVNEQTQVLNKPTKPTIVVATNIAQESITIPYINAVVDNGYCKTLKVNRNGVPELVREPISKADAMQRAGRAGRVMDGTYIWANDISFDNLIDFPAGEIENITLERYVLISLAVGFDPMRELNKAGTKRKVFIHNPNKYLLKLSYDNLRKIGAINSKNKLTELGQELLNYPLDPNIAIMLLNGIDKGCTGNMIDICAIMNHNSFIGKGVKWKNFVKGTYKQDSDLIGLSEFLKLVTTREPLSSEVINKLRKEGVNAGELDLFAQYSANGKEKMLFEIVDLSIIGVKPKKLFEILKTIETLKERLKETGIDISRQEYEEYKGKDIKIKDKIKDNNEKLTRNIVRSVLSGISDNIFEWHKDVKMFYNEKMGRFNPPINTLIKDFSNKSLYTGFPFIIGGSKKDEDIAKGPKGGDGSTPLLFFITKINSGDIEEVNHPFMQETYKDIEFGSKVKGRTKRGIKKLEPCVVANMYKDIGGFNLSNTIEELKNEKLEDVISFKWLPDFMIENNLAIKKYIKSKNKTQKTFNITRFRELLTLFTPTIYHLFDMKNLERTLNTFIHDSSVFDAFYRSEDPRVLEFKQKPSLRKYEDNVVGERRKKEIEKKLDERQKEIMTGINEKRENNEGDDNKGINNTESSKESELLIKYGSKLLAQEKSRKYKAQMLEEIRFLKEETTELNLTKTEINYYVQQIKKKYKIKESTEGINNPGFEVNQNLNFSGYKSLEIIDGILDGNSEYISFEWLSSYLIENNQSIKKFLLPYKKQQRFNLKRFQEILSLFIPELYKKFDFYNIKESLHNYKFDSSVIEKLKLSTDYRVIEFLLDPCKKQYTDKIDTKNQYTFSINNMSLFQRELIIKLREKRKYMILNSSNSIREERIEVESQLAEQRVDKEDESALKERRRNIRIKKKKSNTNRELEILEMRQELREQKELHKAGKMTKQQLLDITKTIEEKYDYTRRVKTRKTKEVIEEPKELTNEQKAAFEIESLEKETKHLLNKKKTEGGITRQDLSRWISEIKIKYGLKIRRTRKAKGDGDNESYIEPEKPKKVVKNQKKTKLDFMRENIKAFIKKSNAEGLSELDINDGIEKIEKSFGYIKPEVKPSSVLVKKEEDNIPVEPTLNQAREGLSKRQYDESIRKLKKQSRNENWLKQKFDDEVARLTEIYENNKPNKNK